MAKSDNTIYIIGGLAALLFFLHSRQQIQATQTTPGQQPNTVPPPGAQVIQHANGTMQLIVPFTPEYTQPGPTPYPGGAMPILQLSPPDVIDAPPTTGIVRALPTFLGPPVVEPKIDPWQEEKPGTVLPYHRLDII